MGRMRVLLILWIACVVGAAKTLVRKRDGQTLQMMMKKAGQRRIAVRIESTDEEQTAGTKVNMFAHKRREDAVDKDGPYAVEIVQQMPGGEKKKITLKDQQGGRMSELSPESPALTFLSNNMAMLSTTIPASSSTATPQKKTYVYWRTMSDAELAKIDEDTAILMVQNAARTYKHHMLESAEGRSDHFNGIEDVVAAFRPAFASMQESLLVVENMKSGEEKVTFESITNGLCETFNRISILAEHVRRAYHASLEAKKATSEKRLSKGAEELLKIASEEGSNSLVCEMLGAVKSHVEENGSLPGEHTLTLHQINKLRKPLEAAITDTVRQNEALRGTFEGAVDVKDTADEIIEYVRTSVRDIFSSAKETKDSVDPSDDGTKRIPRPNCAAFNTPTFRENACCRARCRSQNGESCVWHLVSDASDNCATRTVSCLDPESTPSFDLSDAERALLRKLLTAKLKRQTAAKMFVDFKRLPNKDKCKGMLDTMQFSAAVGRMIPDRGVTNTLTANLRLDDILGSGRSATVEVVGEHRVKKDGSSDVAVGGKFVINRIAMSGESLSLESMNVVLFAKTEHRFTNGVKLNSAFFIDTEIMRPSGEDGKLFDFRGELKLQRDRFKASLGGGGRLNLDGTTSFHANLGIAHEFDAQINGVGTTFLLGLNGGMETSTAFANEFDTDTTTTTQLAATATLGFIF